MIAIWTYFCPRCGRGLESSKCRREGSWLTRLRCPDCPDADVRATGGALVGLGLIIILLTGLCLCDEVPALGLILGTPLATVGLMRIAQRLVARLRARRAREG